MAAGARAGDDARHEAVGPQPLDRLARPAVLHLVLLGAFRELGGVLQMPGIGLHAAERKAVRTRDPTRHGERLLVAGTAGALPPDPEVEEDDQAALGATHGRG
jgi:hypothetical protein